MVYTFHGCLIMAEYIRSNEKTKQKQTNKQTNKKTCKSCYCCCCCCFFLCNPACPQLKTRPGMHIFRRVRSHLNTMVATGRDRPWFSHNCVMLAVYISFKCLWMIWLTYHLHHLHPLKQQISVFWKLNLEHQTSQEIVIYILDRRFRPNAYCCNASNLAKKSSIYIMFSFSLAFMST